MVKRVLLTAVLLVASCTEEVLDTTPLVTAARLLAAQASPAESAPGAALTLRALDVGPDGPAARALGWALCNARPPLTSPGALSPDCLAEEGPDLIAIGVGGAVATSMPASVCQTFGPDQPAPKPGQPPGRPADPDPTGGYYQPVRILAPDAPDDRPFASFEARAHCNLAGASPAKQREYDARYRLNQNPSIVSVALVDDGTVLPAIEADPTAVTVVPAGASLSLRVSWPECPDPDADCGGAEGYVALDPATRAFVDRREELVVSWFATGGQYATAKTGRSEAAALAGAPDDSDNPWTAPADPGDVWLWVVLRDDRGGVTWSSHHLRVE